MFISYMNTTTIKNLCCDHESIILHPRVVFQACLY